MGNRPRNNALKLKSCFSLALLGQIVFEQISIRLFGEINGGGSKGRIGYHDGSLSVIIFSCGDRLLYGSLPDAPFIALALDDHGHPIRRSG